MAPPHHPLGARFTAPFPVPARCHSSARKNTERYDDFLRRTGMERSSIVRKLVDAPVTGRLDGEMPRTASNPHGTRRISRILGLHAVCSNRLISHVREAQDPFALSRDMPYVRPR